MPDCLVFELPTPVVRRLEECDDMCDFRKDSFHWRECRYITDDRVKPMKEARKELKHIKLAIP